MATVVDTKGQLVIAKFPSKIVRYMVEALYKKTISRFINMEMMEFCERNRN